MRQREAQDRVVELVAQPAQHALAEPALQHVDVELEPAVHQDEEQEDDAQEAQQPEPVAVEYVQLEAEEGGRTQMVAVLRVQHLVDDLLRHVERGVVERQRGQRDDQDE